MCNTIVKEDGFTEDTVSRSSALNIIVSKADQLEDMINDLINFLRLETGEWRELLNNEYMSQILLIRNFITAY